MEKKLIIFGNKKCGYCLELENKLINEGIEYHYISTDSEKGLEKFKELMVITQSENIPQAIINNKIVLAPEKSFKTIQQCFDIIKKQLQT